MKKESYIIKGIPEDLAKKWNRKELRDDLVLYKNKDNGAIRGVIKLTKFEAWSMRRHIDKYNRIHPCVLQLRKGTL